MPSPSDYPLTHLLSCHCLCGPGILECHPPEQGTLDARRVLRYPSKRNHVAKHFFVGSNLHTRARLHHLEKFTLFNEGFIEFWLTHDKSSVITDVAAWLIEQPIAS